VNESVK